MDDTTRLQYLHLLGVTVWRTKESALTACSQKLDEPVEEKTQALSDIPTSGQDTETAWRLLQDEIEHCQACRLAQSRTQTVFGSGNRQADWMLIGEAPGFHEDQQGQPFVGRAGLLLTEMLRAVGLSREQVFIANILKCRPPDNRDPKADEVEACANNLQRQIQLVKPKILLALGRVAAQNLLKTDLPLGKLRGTVHLLNGIPVVVIYHPAYLLRSLLEKRKAWQDLQMAMRVYRDAVGHQADS